MGTEGTIVLEYDGTHFEVEYYNANGNTIDVVTTPAEIIELVSDFDEWYGENGVSYSKNLVQKN